MHVHPCTAFVCDQQPPPPYLQIHRRRALTWPFCYCVCVRHPTGSGCQRSPKRPSQLAPLPARLVTGIQSNPQLYPAPVNGLLTARMPPGIAKPDARLMELGPACLPGAGSTLAIPQDQASLIALASSSSPSQPQAGMQIPFQFLATPGAARGGAGRCVSVAGGSTHQGLPRSSNRQARRNLLSAVPGQNLAAPASGGGTDAEAR